MKRLIIAAIMMLAGSVNVQAQDFRRKISGRMPVSVSADSGLSQRTALPASPRRTPYLAAMAKSAWISMTTSEWNCVEVRSEPGKRPMRQVCLPLVLLNYPRLRIISSPTWPNCSIHWPRISASMPWRVQQLPRSRQQLHPMSPRPTFRQRKPA